MPFDFTEYKKQDEFEVDEAGLATTASNLIRQAIKDLVQAEESDKYYIDMGTWHNPSSTLSVNPRCVVCLAGAVMAHTLQRSHLEYANPGNYDNETMYKLESLNTFRMGMVEFGLNEFYRHDKTDLKNIPAERNMIKYTTDSEIFKRDMLSLADDLEAVGY